MPYTIRTKDGIVIKNIPDDVPRDSQILKDRVARARADRSAGKTPQEASQWKDTEYGYKIRPAQLPETGEPTVEREDGALWVGPEQGNTEAPGWFRPDGSRARDTTKPPGFWERLGESLRYGVTKSTIGAAQAMAESNAAGGMLGVARGGLVPSYIPERGVSQEDYQKDAEAMQAVASEANRRFKEGTGGGIIPTVISEMVDPANLVGAVVPAGKAATIPGRIGMAMARGAAQAAPAAMARPMEPGQSRIKSAITETALGGFGAGTIQGLSEGVSAVGRAYSRLGQEAAESAVPAGVAGGAVEAAAPVAGKPPIDDAAVLAQKASGTGLSAKAARDRLADLYDVDPEALAAGKALGLDLPADIYSVNRQIQAIAAAGRGIKGELPQSRFFDAVEQTSQKMDDALRSFDAKFIEGKVAPAEVNTAVKKSLADARSTAMKQAADISDEINQNVPKTSKASLTNLKKTLEEIKSEVGTEFSGEESALLKFAGSQNPTYGGLMRAKQTIGDAIGKKNDAFQRVGTADLKRLYAALAEDQLENVGNILGDQARSDMRLSNQLFSKAYAVEKRMVTAFGKDLEGGMSNLMTQAFSPKGLKDPGSFNKLIKVVPPEMRKEAIATAIAEATRRGEKAGFDFGKMTQLYEGIRANKDVAKQVYEALGPDSEKMLRHMYSMSKRVQQATSLIRPTGESNQPLIAALGAQSILEKVFETSIPKRAATALGGIVAGTPGAIVGSDVGERMAHALTQTPKQKIMAISNLIDSDEFRTLVVEAATKPRPSQQVIKAVAKSKAFDEYARRVGIPRDVDSKYIWLVNSIRTAPMEQPENRSDR